MSELNELAAALVAAQAEFDAIPKTADNPFFKSKFAPLKDVVRVTRPILAKHGLAVSQFPCIHPETKGPGLKTILLHTSGQSLSEIMDLCAAKKDPQGQGAAITYGRRYAYESVLGLVTDEDDDGNKAVKAKQSESRPSNAEGRAALRKLCEAQKLEPGVVAALFQKQFGVPAMAAPNDDLLSFVALAEQGAIPLEPAG